MHTGLGSKVLDFAKVFGLFVGIVGVSYVCDDLIAFVSLGSDSISTASITLLVVVVNCGYILAMHSTSSETTISMNKMLFKYTLSPS
jgi:hypothetical protein